MARAVRFDTYGGRDVLYIADVPIPTPAKGEVVVEVRAAGINPGEASIRSGASKDTFRRRFLRAKAAIWLASSIPSVTA